MSTDLFPTLLELARLPAQPSNHMDGASLAGSMLDGAEEVHEALFWHFPHYHGSGNRPGGAVRIGDLKLVEWFEDGEVELYDLSTDLGERRDLSSERPDDTDRLLSELRDWRVDLDANMPTRR